PECQVIMMRLGGQVLDLLHACATGTLDQAQVHWANDHALTVVMAARGYPGGVEKGSVIGGVDTLPSDVDHMCFHAGTARNGDGAITANGGRVLNLTARGTTLLQAQNRAYDLVDTLDWPDGFCRRDIGWRALR
ncbi:MAG: phosphoribosylglycinamide synthetase C domain-containing protein, partial [Pseudomonadota bacterium]